MSNTDSFSLVEWREWNDETFQEAQKLDKPILLDIGAVWCHWCHVMDHGIEGDPVHTGTYSDPDIAGLINDLYIPIKVDNDRRPDINARYNMGGWPTTVFLTPRGEPLYGETYVPPRRMVDLLQSISNYYKTNRDEIAARIDEHDQETAANETGPDVEPELSADALKWIAAQILNAFDEPFGGFGTQPKFPHIDTLEFVLVQAVKTGDKQLLTVFDKTLSAMAGGGMYDRFAGGFFRYSTTRDWSIPHYEKMLEDNARLSCLAFLAGRLLRDEKYTLIGKDVHRWLFDTMLDSATGCFAGSQDADAEEEYYGLPLDKRAKLATPYIDRTIYLGWNAMMVSSLCERYRTEQSDEILATAKKCFTFLTESIWPHHYHDVESQNAGGSQMLLTDAAPLINAALDLADITGEQLYINQAVEITDSILGKLQDVENGGFYDMPRDLSALGELKNPVQELGPSCEMASVLLKIYAFTEDTKYRLAAESAIKSWAGDLERHGLFAASFGLSLDSHLIGPIRVVIAGDPSSDDVNMLRNVAWSSPVSRYFSVEVARPNDSQQFTLTTGGKSRAFICFGTTCTVAETPEELGKRLKSIAEPAL